MTALVVCAWTIVGVLAVAAVLHIVARDRDSYVFALDAYTFWLFLPAYAVLLGALIGRRWWLVGTGLALVACHIVWIMPMWRGAAPIPAAAQRAPHFTLVTANLRYDNPEPAALAQELKATNADVLDVQEFTQAWSVIFQHSGLFRAYPYRVLDPVEGPGGTAILSRLPLRSPTTLIAKGDRMACATISVGEHSVRLLAVHPRAPTNFSLYAAQRDAVTEFARQAQRPLILAGDFNTTQYNAWLGQLEHLGLRSAHTLLGKGLATTWPNGTNYLPPIQLDHVLVSQSVVPLSIREGRGRGSDHKPVIVQLAVT